MSHFIVRRTYLRVTDCNTGDLIRFHLNLSVIFRSDFIHLITSFGKPTESAGLDGNVYSIIFIYNTVAKKQSV